jgi:hypothetical protein
MTGRLKILATAALGLVLAAGTLADVSAKTVTGPSGTHQVHARTHTAATVAHKGHRLHTANLRRAHKLHVARHAHSQHIAKTGAGIKSTKEAGSTTAQRERHAMNHRAPSKAARVIR